MGISEVRRQEVCATTLPSGHQLYHSKANNGQAGVGFHINRKRKDHIGRVNNISPRVSELVLSIIKLETEGSAKACTNNIILKRKQKYGQIWVGIEKRKS